MRFSLGLSFSLLTLCCLSAWIYQLRSKAAELVIANEALTMEVIAFEPYLQRDVELLRLADAQKIDRAADPFIIFENFLKEKIDALRLPPDFTSKNLVVRQILSMRQQTLTERAPLEFQIFNPIPDGVIWTVKPKSTLSTEEKQQLQNEVLDFEEPIEIKIPSGISTMMISTEHAFTKFSKFTFKLNEKIVAEVKTVPPQGLPKYFFSGGLINGTLAASEIEITPKTKEAALVARSLYKDIRDNFQEFRATIGFCCFIEIDQHVLDNPDHGEEERN